MTSKDLSSLNASRRAFLRTGAQLSAAGLASPIAGGLALQLAAMGEAAAQTATGYKALVCVFLYGGNDYANTLVPYDTSNYNLYNTLRGGLATAQTDLVSGALSPITALTSSRQYALSPDLNTLTPGNTKLSDLFNTDRKLAALLNIGTLIQPTTKAQYTAKNVPLPPKLFSHNDQQSVWQSGLAEGATSGWGGRIGDLMMSGNGNSTFTCVSVTGNSVFLSGSNVAQYQVTSNGPVALSAKTSLFGSAACSTTLKSLMTQTRGHLIESELTRVAKRSLDAYDVLNSATSSVSLATTFPTTGNSLASQLQYVAKMIAARGTLGNTRQVFFVSLGGFDTHDNLTVNHAALLKQVGPALRSFYDATVALGVANDVTTFTASDFGRTLTSNGNGSDHGWGSMHFVLGGAVKGGEFYGKAPDVANNGADDVGQGRLLPSIATDQLNASLATWFGVSGTDLTTVIPNLPNYTVKNLNIL